MAGLWRDLRYSLRALLHAPAFTGIAVLTLSIGIGSTTSIFSVVNAVVLNPLPYPDPGELVTLGTYMTDGRETGGTISPFALTRLNEQSASFTAFAGAYRWEVAIRDLEDRPLKTSAYIVTEGYFDILRKPMTLGRGFLPEEHGEDGGGSVILSHRLWESAFNGDPSLVGRSIPSGPGSLTVVGVAAPDHDLPLGADLWIAFRPDPNQAAFFLEGIGRLTPGVAIEQGRAELATLSRRFEEESASFRNRAMEIESLHVAIVGDMSTTLMILLGAAGVLLLIACANVMNLLLSRGASRTREVAVRAALGAGTWRLVRQLLTESMTLAAFGAVVGLMATWGSLALLEAVGPADLPRATEIGIDGTVLGFAVLAAAATGLLFGAVPALRLVGTDIRSLMGGSSRGMSGSGRVFTGLVVAQTGLAAALVIASGLLVRSYQRLQAVEGGFDPHSVVVMDMNLPGSLYPDYREVARSYENLISEVVELPGVTAVGAASTLPLGEQLDFFLSTTIVGQDSSDDPERARFRQASAGFFDAAGLELVEGRLFTDQDRVDVAGVAVVNEAFVNRLLGGEPPLGQQVQVGNFGNPDNPLGYRSHESFEIVGVVRDIRYLSLSTPGEPSLYVPLDQVPFRRMFLTVKAAGQDATTLIPGIREAFRKIDRTLPVEFNTMDAMVSASLGRERMAMLLLLAFGRSAGVLAAVGLYGVISFGVRERTTEMAIRASLGATPDTVLWLSMVRGLGMALVGLAAGVVVSLVGQSVIATQLYEVSAHDPFIMIGAPLMLSLVAFVSVLVPALRATRISLSETLRGE
jgi:predicted permease